MPSKAPGGISPEADPVPGPPFFAQIFTYNFEDGLVKLMHIKGYTTLTSGNIVLRNHENLPAAQPEKNSLISSGQ